MNESNTTLKHNGRSIGTYDDRNDPMTYQKLYVQKADGSRSSDEVEIGKALPDILRAHKKEDRALPDSVDSQLTILLQNRKLLEGMWATYATAIARTHQQGTLAKRSGELFERAYEMAKLKITEGPEFKKYADENGIAYETARGAHDLLKVLYNNTAERLVQLRSLEHKVEDAYVREAV